MAATGALALVARTSKPGGALSTKSPWLAQTRSSGGTLLSSGPLPVTATVACPYSRSGERATRPPSAEVMICIP